MNNETADEIIACLPQERTLFQYFKGQFAFTLLSFASRALNSIKLLKQSPYSRLLNRPDVKTLLASQGNGRVSPELFNYAWGEPSEHFVLTLDKWEEQRFWGNQTSRPGCNLVLQLNFSEKHNRAYRKLVKPHDEFVFNFDGHPVMTIGSRHFFRDTLAWARIDLDFHTGEALIEEVQSDWVRRVKSCVTGIESGEPTWHLDYCDCEEERFLLYVKRILAPFFSLWSEAMLTATIDFIYRELGIHNIYYHTFGTGTQIKQIMGAPPRSLYTDLPRKFCFQTTQQDPEFLLGSRAYLRKRRKLKEIHWYKLKI